MAHVEERETKRCSCCGCRAKITTWSCGCVTVEILDEAETGVCGDCDNFSDMSRSCGRSGCPACGD